MDERRAAQLERLYSEGSAADAREPDRERRRRNLEPPSAALLAQLVRISAARTIVEIGTSNGYSAIWLADAAANVAGHVTSVDITANESAKHNLGEAGLSELVDLVVADGGDYLGQVAAAGVDLLFLDADRTAYLGWWPDVQRVVRPGGLLVIDNVLAPDPAELTDIIAAISAADHWTSATVSIGKGLLLAWKSGSPR